MSEQEAAGKANRALPLIAALVLGIALGIGGGVGIGFGVWANDENDFKPLAWYTLISTGAENISMSATGTNGTFLQAELVVPLDSVPSLMMTRIEMPSGMLYSTDVTAAVLDYMDACYALEGPSCNVDSAANPYAGLTYRDSMKLTALSVLVREPNGTTDIYPYHITSVTKESAQYVFSVRVHASGQLSERLISPYMQHEDFTSEDPHFHMAPRPDTDTDLARLAPGQTVQTTQFGVEIFCLSF